jgi:hypothetical protein
MQYALMIYAGPGYYETLPAAEREAPRAAYQRALELATSTPERRFLTGRLEQLTASVLSDGVTFVALAELRPDGGDPLAALPAYAELVENLKQWYAEPPAVERMTVIGSYQLF